MRLEVCCGLVNNAACQDRGRLDQVTEDAFRRMMAANALGPLFLIQALRENLARNGGRVVNIGSTNAYGGEQHLLVYSMSKAALACATRNLAPSLAQEGIRICQVNLGWVLTEAEKRRKVEEGWPADWYQSPSAHRAPFGRLFTPEEVGEFVSFLFSEACSMLNGSILDFAQTAVGMAAQS